MTMMTKKTCIIILLFFHISLFAQQKAEENKKEPKPSYNRLLIELGGILVIGSFDSFIHDGNCFPYTEEAGGDFKYNSFSQGFFDKLSGSGIRFDDNAGTTNIGHSFAGSLYYSIARSNHFSSYQSFLFGLAAFTIWEAGAEYREIFSINDAIVTPVGGIAIAESSYQISQFFAKSKDTTRNHIFKIITNPIASINRYFDSINDVPLIMLPLGSDGYPKNYWHEFKFYVGIIMASVSDDQGKTNNDLDIQSTDLIKTGLNLGSHFEVNKIFRFCKSGRASGFMTDTLYSSQEISLITSKAVVQSFSFDSESVLLGFFARDIEKKKKKLHGYNYYVGLKTGLHIQYSPAVYEDWYLAIEVLGITAEGTYFNGNWRFKNKPTASFLFSLVKPLVAEAYADSHNLNQAQSVFQTHQYFYAYGLVIADRLQISYKNWELEAIFNFATLLPFKAGFDKDDDTLKTPDFREKSYDSSLIISYFFRERDMKLSLVISYMHRKSRIEEVKIYSDMSFVESRLSFLF